MSADPHAALRKDLVRLLEGGGAHLRFDDAVRDASADEIGKRANGYTLWRLVEHVRIAQHDLLDYGRNPDYQAPRWPDDYWPEGDAPKEGDAEAAFARSCDAFREDAAALRAIVEDPSVDPTAPIPHADNTTLVRNILLASDHTTYHLGEIVMLRKTLGTWPGSK